MKTQTVALLGVVIGSVSLLVAGASLSWQIAQFALFGGRPRVLLRHGAIGRGGAAFTDVKRPNARANMTSPAKAGFAEEVPAVKVVNRGRMAVVVENYSCRHERSGCTFTPLAEAIGPALPHRLEPGSSESWMVRVVDVESLSRASEVLREGNRVHLCVAFADGRELATSSWEVSQQRL